MDFTGPGLTAVHPPPRDMVNTEPNDFATDIEQRMPGSYSYNEKTFSVSEKNEYGVTENSRSNSELGSESNIDPNLKYTDTTLTSFEQEQTGQLFRDDGTLVLLPAPTNDPRDPLTMSFKRKFLGVICLCFFGAFAAAAELILGAMLPVFALYYAGIDPKFLIKLTDGGGLPLNSDPLKELSQLPNAPPIWHIYLLASVPVLMIGASNLVLIPLAISIGRRPVVLGTGIIAIAGCLWAGFSGSLGSHIGARTVQALGAGTVESLIPFIIQDIAYVHQRNTWISCLFATQGMIIIALGIGSPYIIINLNWRYVYYITAAVAAFFLVGVFFFLPETRYPRTRAEMNGVPKVEDPDVVYKKRTWKSDMALLSGPREWRKGWLAFVDTLRTFFYPHIFFITMLNSAMIATAFAAGYTVAPALLTKPWSWPFLHLGLCLIPVLIAAICVGGVTGYLADWTANWVAKRRGKRVPENQLLNLVLPTAAALAGSVIFGVAGNDLESYSPYLFLFGLGLAAFGFLGANTIGAVYVLECYPHLAGPALVNIASFRCLIAFVLSFKVSDWVANLGYFDSMMIYTGIMAFFAALIPVVYIWGPAWRKRWPAERFGEH